MNLTPSQLKMFLALTGFWFILSCSALYGLGRSHGRAENNCTRAEKQVEELRATLGECRDDIEEARVASVQAEAVKCKARLEEYKRIRCRLCEAGVVP
jgi:hypothetical protein